MGSFTDKLLRLIGYLVIIIFIIVIGLVIYAIYSIVSYQKEVEPPTETQSIELQLQNDLGGPQQTDVPVTYGPPEYNEIQAYESPENKIPNSDDFNPFDEDLAIGSQTEHSVIKGNKATTIEELIPQIQSKYDEDNTSSKPIDPTNKNQPNLDLLF